MERKLPNGCCIVGKFESFHLGHQKLIDEAKKLCGRVKVISINKFAEPVLFTNEEREEISKTLGVELVNLNFEEIKDLTPWQFFKVLKELGCSFLLAGKDWRFGKNRVGDVDTAKVLGKQFGIRVEDFPLVEVDGKKVGTTLIKEFLKKGNLEKTNELLGFPYFSIGKVVRGRGIGKELGFPTLNVETGKKLLIPFGVYKVELSLNGKNLLGVANYGVKPTFGENPPTLEVHIPNRNLPENLEGKKVKINFLRFLRKEKKFHNVEELKKQIKFDIEKLNS